MVREKNHLGPGRNVRQRLQSGRSAAVVEFDQDIVDDKRHGFVSVEVVLDARQTQGQVELIRRAVAHALHRHDLPAARPHAHEHGVAVGVAVRPDTFEEPHVIRLNRLEALFKIGPWLFSRKRSIARLKTRVAIFRRAY